MNGIDLILADHRQLDALFATFDETGDATLIGQILDLLSAHDDAEQSALYPLAAKLLADPALIERSQLAHSEIKKIIDVLKVQEGQPLVDAVILLHSAVTEHVRDEEDNLLPALNGVATTSQLDGLAARIEQVKQRVG